MKCNLEKLSAYLDGVLPEAKRALLEDHLKTCEACAAKLDELARLEAAAKKIPVPKLSEAYWENFASRVQNKITIRDKQKSTQPWLENLKRFFQPTTGKLALAGSLATILLVAMFGQDYWKKEAYRPPVFDGQEVKSPMGLNDSLQKSDLPEERQRQVRADQQKLAAGGRRDEPSLQKNMRENKQKGLLAPPVSAVASKPAGETAFRHTLKDEKASETDLVEGRVQKQPMEESAPVAAGKKAEATADVDVSEYRPTAKMDDKRISTASRKPAAGIENAIEPKKSKESGVMAFAQPKTLRSVTMPPIDTAKAIADLKRIIAEKEKLLTVELFKETAESLYVFLGDYYVDLYRFSLQTEDWDKANLRLNEFLQKAVSESTRQRLTAIQAELKSIKK